MRRTPPSDDDPTRTTSTQGNRRRRWIAAGAGCATVLSAAVVLEIVPSLADVDGDEGTPGPTPSATPTVGTSATSSTAPPAVDPRPFYEAVDRLGAALVIDYTLSDLGMEWEFSITQRGDGVGTMTNAGIQTEVLLADGTAYVKFDDDFLSFSPHELPALGQEEDDLPPITTPSGSEAAFAQAESAWVVVDDHVAPFGPGPEELMSPAELSETLRRELDLTADLTDTGGMATEIDGTSVIGVRTSGYEIYISNEAPHDVVRLTPRTEIGTPSDLPDLPELPGLFELPELPAGFADLRLDVDAKNADDEEALQALTDIYALLLEQVQQLVDAIDPSVLFDISSALNVACGSTCTATVPITSTPAGTDVDARMQVMFTVDGVYAGTCQASGRLPGGVGSLSCSSAEAATLGNSRLRQKAAVAPRGTTVYVNYLAEASVTAIALPDDEIEDLLMQMYEDYLQFIEDVCSFADLAAEENLPGAEETTCEPALDPQLPHLKSSSGAA